MVIYRNKYIPFQGFKAINLFGILFVRGNAIINEKTIRHEKIHTAQMKEMWYIFFYIWYGIEWLIRLCIEWNVHKVYRKIGFEREAYDNQNIIDYPEIRQSYSWMKYLHKK